MEKQKREKDMKVSELAVLMRDAFQSNQDYMDKITQEMRDGFQKTNENFSEIKTQIHNISKNNVDVVRQPEFDKLEDRVGVVEEVLHLKLKRA